MLAFIAALCITLALQLFSLFENGIFCESFQNLEEAITEKNKQVNFTNSTLWCFFLKNEHNNPSLFKSQNCGDYQIC